MIINSISQMRALLAFIGIFQFAQSFAPTHPSLSLSLSVNRCQGTAVVQSSTSTSTSINMSKASSSNSNSNSATRKEFITAAGVLTSIVTTNRAAFADGDESSLPPPPPTGPITIIGSNGKTGSECVGACLSRSIPVRATSRSGIYSGIYADETNKLFSTMPCDVTIPSTIQSAIEGSRAVIFAASASKQGGTAKAVDNEGLVNVAKACIAAKVPSLVIVSSGAVTKPDSPVYKFLNLFGKIMEEKIKGEDAVRSLYSSSGSDSVCTYTVIRPGGLTEEAAEGVGALELNQGDTKSGRIARADVASLCIEATFFPQLTGGTTFECYAADTAKPLASVGMSNIMKAKNKGDSDAVFMSGKERRGDTFEKIFTGLEKDAL